MIYSVTGHRILNKNAQGIWESKIWHNTNTEECFLWLYRFFLQELKTLSSPEKLVTGGALGVDQAAAMACVKLGIPFILAVPFEGQEKLWNSIDKKRFKELEKRATEVIFVSGPGFSARKMQERNEWMVDHSDTLLAFWNGDNVKSGTGNCVAYAKKKNKKILNLFEGWERFKAKRL